MGGAGKEVLQIEDTTGVKDAGEGGREKEVRAC